jgi:Putative transposase of IS4/5 family (DUF4096)/Transposase DDE domain
MADIARWTKRYPSDVNDEERERIQPLLPEPPKRGRELSVELREMPNAIRYMARSGSCWRMPLQTIHDVSLKRERGRVGRQASPSGGVLDSQSAKAPHGQTRGYDANKKIVGRKHHIAVDIDGRLLIVNLTTADISDSAGARATLEPSASAGLGSSTYSPMACDRAKLLDKAVFRLSGTRTRFTISSARRP